MMMMDKLNIMMFENNPRMAPTSFCVADTICSLYFTSPDSKFEFSKLHALYNFFPTTGQSATLALGGGITSVFESMAPLSPLTSLMMDVIINMEGTSIMQSKMMVMILLATARFPFTSFSVILYKGYNVIARIIPHKSVIAKGNTIITLQVISKLNMISLMNRSMVFFSIDVLLTCMLSMEVEVWV